MNHFDKMMYEYYRVLNNAWKGQIKVSAKQAIQMLSDLPKHERLKNSHIDDIVQVVNMNMGEEFASLVRQETKVFTTKSMRLGINDAVKDVKSNISVGLYGIRQQKLETQINKQNLFWIGNKFGTDMEAGFKKSLIEAVSSGYTKEMLANKLQEQFQHLGKQSTVYWQGLAEHTGLRIREFGRLEGYKKAGATGYRLLVVLDDRTSEICQALAAEDRIYPLDEAIDTMESLLNIDTTKSELAEVKEQTKKIAPWVSEKQIRYENDKPVGVNGDHTPFPPFHWKCRTTTGVI